MWYKRTYNQRPYSRRTNFKNTNNGNIKKFKKGHYCYSLNLSNGKKYVGYTSNPNKRFSDHFQGKGAKVTKKYKPISIYHIQKCKSIYHAKKAERLMYFQMKKRFGIKKVRGAGYTNSINF
jgi:putative endonuclease